jgi:hypothetical protein
MSRTTKITSARTFLRKAAALALSRSVPAWIDASEGGTVAPTVMPFIRDALILRPVELKRSLRARTHAHASGAF